VPPAAETAWPVVLGVILHILRSKIFFDILYVVFRISMRAKYCIVLIVAGNWRIEGRIGKRLQAKEVGLTCEMSLLQGRQGQGY
jgi:hypothetical protein